MIRHYLPKSWCDELFGDRERYGQKAWDNDPDWQKWLELYTQAYTLTQRSSLLQRHVNNAGYDVLRDIDMYGLDVGEIGPGGAYHFRHFRGVPASYHAFDVCEEFFEKLPRCLPDPDIALHCHKVEAYVPHLPAADASLDAMLSFYSMEHLYPLEGWTREIFRVLKPGGRLVGAIPTEGGLAWGLGRWLTSRRSIKRDYGLDLRKIVCWEHPNTCDAIVDELHNHAEVQVKRWPLNLAGFDMNLVVKFIATKPAHG